LIPYVDVFYTAPDGLTLHARDYNSAARELAPIVCLPGLTRNARDFEDLANRLAPTRRVIVAEQRGRGQSAYDPNPENYQPTIYVGDMIALLDHLALPLVAIIGTSLGGLMAMLMAASWPDRFAGIFLNDIGPQVAPEGIARIRDYIDRVPQVSGWDDAARDVQCLFGGSFPLYKAAEWQKMARALYRESADGVPMLDYDPAIAVVVKGSASAAPDLWPVFDRLPPLPLAVARGALSNILAADTLAEMRRRRPDLMVAEIADVGHVPMLDEAPARQLIERFLAAIDAKK